MCVGRRNNVSPVDVMLARPARPAEWLARGEPRWGDLRRRSPRPSGRPLAGPRPESQAGPSVPESGPCLACSPRPLPHAGRGEVPEAAVALCRPHTCRPGVAASPWMPRTSVSPERFWRELKPKTSRPTHKSPLRLIGVPDLAAPRGSRSLHGSPVPF